MLCLFGISSRGCLLCRSDMMHKLSDYLKQHPNASFELVKRMIDIPLLLAPDNDPRKKKLRNNMKRKKNKMKKKGP